MNTVKDIKKKTIRFSPFIPGLFSIGKGEKPAFLQREDDDEFPIQAEKESKPATKRKLERPMSKKRQMKVTGLLARDCETIDFLLKYIHTYMYI